MVSPQFRYFDLNNNVYTIDKLKVEFEPLTKEKSFTGKYDGGKATKGKLTQKNHDKLSSKIDTILDSKSLRIKHRSGVCAMLIVYGEEKTKRVILPESPEQGKIDELLRSACGLD